MWYNTNLLFVNQTLHVFVFQFTVLSTTTSTATCHICWWHTFFFCILCCFIILILSCINLYIYMNDWPNDCVTCAILLSINPQRINPRALNHPSAHWFGFTTQNLRCLYFESITTCIMCNLTTEWDCGVFTVCHSTGWIASCVKSTCFLACLLVHNLVVWYLGCLGQESKCL